MTSRELFGYVLGVIGALGLVFSGLCTVSFGGIALLGFIGSGGREGGDYLAAVFMMGVLPMVVFWFLLKIGRGLVGGRAAAEPAPEAAPRKSRDADDDDPWMSS